MATSFQNIVHNPDPKLTRLNIFALMLAINQLLYAPSLMLLVGHDGIAGWPVMLSAPFFAATPWILRHWPEKGRAWVPLVGIINSFLAQITLGAGSEVWVFVLPCLALAALILRRQQRAALIGLSILAMGVLFLPPGMGSLSLNTAGSIARINEGSVIILTGFIGWLFI